MQSLKIYLKKNISHKYPTHKPKSQNQSFIYTKSLNKPENDPEEGEAFYDAIEEDKTPQRNSEIDEICVSVCAKNTFHQSSQLRERYVQ